VGLHSRFDPPKKFYFQAIRLSLQPTPVDAVEIFATIVHEQGSFTVIRRLPDSSTSIFTAVV
jgi:uncharacterized protein (UPF0262 family)